MNKPHRPDHRGLGKKFKYAMPEPVFEILRRLYNFLLRLVPYGIKYGIGTSLRRKKYPYSLVRDGDVLVQVGAPRDILLAGRSRAIHFARLVGSGKVVIVEADPENCKMLRRFIKRYGLEGQALIVESGVWKNEGELVFMSSPLHPAANVLVDAREIPEEIKNDRQYEKIYIKVNTLDNILAEAGIEEPPRIVSLTTNGAELEIMAGMPDTLAKGVPYISLASTGEGYEEGMKPYGYRFIAFDDRGYTFAKDTAAAVTSTIA